MPKYCLDTSGLSNPVMDLPAHIYVSLWPQVEEKISQGFFCWNVEIAEELESIFGPVGDTLKACNGDCCMEVGDDSWPWQEYLQTVEAWRVTYKQYISEYNGNRKRTISLNDLSIVAMAKTISLPVVSMETRNTGQPSTTKLRIPDLCDVENVDHYSFNEFLEAEGVTI